MVNRYRTEFFARCPNNGIRVHYRFCIETAAVVRVEDIIAAVDAVKEGFHEEIANNLSRRFGGLQTLTAEHHGVTIETVRP